MAIINFNSISGVSTVTATHSVTVGDTFIKDSKVGLGTITTADRNAGVGTAIGTIVYNETSGEVQIYKRNTGWVNISNVGDTSNEPLGMTATGGVVSDYTDPGPGAVYRAHVFTSSGTFEVSALSSTLPNSVEYLVVAGGGSGGAKQAGGGGAGGLRTNLSGHPLAGSEFPVSTSPGSYTVTIGAGGAPQSAPSVRGNSGTNSVFGTIVSAGGGGGGSGGSVPVGPAGNGGDGGSGGGGAAWGTSAGSGGAGNTPPSSPAQGTGGGNAFADSGNTRSAGGGGGAGGNSEVNGIPTRSGNGGPGVQVAIAGPASATTGVGALNPGPGQYQWFAGGGGGGAYGESGLPAGSGGVGGGGTGNASDDNLQPYQNAQASTGGGGGGAGGGPSGGVGGNGGSGIVVVRYQIGVLKATAKATGGAISYYDGKTIHTFTSTGTFTTPASFSETVEYVVVGGGGAGGTGGGNGGGGGAGSYRTSTTPISGSQSITVQVGSGAAPVTIRTLTSSGTPSYFGTPITAPGGGGGASDDVNPTKNGTSGGSGGGGGGGGVNNANNTGATGTGDPFPGTIGSTPANGWGNDGGTGGQGSASDNGGGGGGGAGGVGGNNAPGNPGGDGGLGMQLPATFRNPASTVAAPGPTTAYTNGDTSGKYWLAAGGGGGAGGSGTQGVGGGSGGPYGGAGSGNSPIGNNALENTGSGGGGSTTNSGSGSGGSGIVLIAYPS